ncbi:16S rRNA (uracil(1498)-N(3))-methyltransferase [Geomonas sp. Red875]|uniref:Ribosomal RNA small subunit methyltransferase E n=2 Tax=Geomesophilobacter sediminis TaxID=2798584 RepID=A0A8J7J1L6_9BACT|nr:16S rRNA (uracil(1498)-N(3))-methyltransferase [Geomesophilobacter sediminis]
MRNFFLGDNAVVDDEACITGELYRHMARVLRLKAGAAVSLTDGAGRSFDGVITEVGAKSLTVKVSAPEAAAESSGYPAITLYQGLPKGEKFDLILQKCTELGVAEVVAFQAARSVVKLKEDRSAGRLERCERIVQEAARQSGRKTIPKVSFAGALGPTLRGNSHSVKLLLWEGERVNGLRQALAGMPAPESIAVIVGPEGGLTDEEVRQAQQEGFIPVSLGSRILRTETAGLAIVSILQFHWGDIG